MKIKTKRSQKKQAEACREERMRLPIYIEGKKYKLSYYKYIAYHSLKRIERLEKKIRKRKGSGERVCGAGEKED